MVVKAKLVAKDEVINGYSTYVFECLDDEIREQTKYIMCTRFPNWDAAKINLDSEGFLHFEEREAGKDQWYNQETQQWHSFSYNMIQFMRFIEFQKKKDNEYIM